MEHVQITKRLRLDRAILIGAFAGWNDAASAATWAVKFLINHWDAQPFAEIDPEIFYDFTETRPSVRVTSGALRRLSWPSNRFYLYHAPADEAATLLDNARGKAGRALTDGADNSDNGDNGDNSTDDSSFSPASSEGTAVTPAASSGRDIILFLGEEPHLRWRTFAKEFVELARELHVEDMALLGSLVAEVPHTAPVQISGATSRTQALKRMQQAGVERVTYSGPTGMLTVLQDTARKDGIASTSLWGSAPHYVSATPNLPVSEALLRKLDALYSLDLRLNDLGHAAQRFTRRVSTLVAEDPDVSAYVRELERRTNTDHDVFSEQPLLGDASGIHRIPMDGELPTPQEAVEDVEAWLRRFRSDATD
ncbi:MAG TPA: PAC2 family protein [Ktedonobacterales bacterium]|nr:PAC2 family protein [Ktedonobacterales bacterium]